MASVEQRLNQIEMFLMNGYKFQKVLEVNPEVEKAARGAAPASKKPAEKTNPMKVKKGKSKSGYFTPSKKK